MAIERIMAEGGISPETGGATSGEPNVVVAPDEKPGVLRRLFRRGPQSQVLVKPGTQVQTSQNVQPNVSTEQVPINDFDQRAVERWEAEGGATGNGGGGDNGGPGGPGSPEGGGGGPEYIWSPEFKAERWRVAYGLRRLEGLPYKELYGNAENRRLLHLFYRQWKYLESLDTTKSHESKPFDPADLGESIQAAQLRVSYPPQDLTSIPEIIQGQAPTVKGWSERYKELLESPIPADAQQVTEREMNINHARDYLSRYFKEAHTTGLLDAVDAELNSIAKEIQHGLDQGLSPGEIMAGKQESYARGTEGTTGVDKRIEVARDLGRRAFATASAANPNIASLAEVWDVYINLALERLTDPFNPRLTLPIPIDGEFTFAGERGEALSRILEEEGETYWRPTYANYFTIYARNREQFDRAKETFIRWARTGLGKAPTELFQKVNGFKEALTSAGQRAGPEMQQYTVEVRQELEAIVGGIEANLFNELYNPENFKRSWEFVAETPEGTDRMLRLIKTSRGIMAAVLHKLAKDPSLELLHSPHGSRGQLMGIERNAIEMRSLQGQIIETLTAEALGISLKVYHPDDPEKRSGNNRNMYERNLGEITKFKSDEYFKNLYEGFDLEAQEKLYQELKQKQDLKPAEQKTLDGLERARRIQQYLETGNDPGGLKGADKVMYEEAKNAVTLAWEVFGAMGEKAQRGGTVFVVDRKDAEGNKFMVYIPDYWARKVGHLAENWNKATYGGALDEATQAKLRAEGWVHPNSTGLFADELFYKVGQARRFSIWAMKVYGRDAKLWDFTLLRNGKPVDPNILGYTQYGANPDADNEIDRYRYAAPVNERILGYNSKGEEVILVFDDNGKPMTLEFDSEGISTGSVIPLEYDRADNAVIYDKPVKTKEWSEHEHKLVDVEVKDRKRITFDNLNKNTKARQMLLKTPKGTIDSKTGKMIVEDTAEIPVDFDTVIYQLSSHPYARWTGNPYPGYQEEWTGLLLSKASLEAAKEIKAGRLRPEDAPPHAVQLLMVDPTLERVGHFEIENLEPLVVLAAQEESYQSEWRIGDELYLNFLPTDASRVKNRTAYVLEDHGGSTKQWYHIRGEAALWPDSRTRRLRIFTPYISVDFASMSQMWGAPGGPLDVFRMMAYAKYKMVGQFAFDKWNNQTGAAQHVYESVTDWYDPQAIKLREGLGRKLNNEADTNLKKFYQQVIETKELRPETRSTREDIYQQFLVSARESLNRIEVFENRNTVLQSVFRGERAPLYLEGIEIYKRQPDGAYELDGKGNRILNPKVDSNRDSGSSRHRNKFFHYRYARFLRSPAGQALYPDVGMYYALLDNYLIDYPRLAKEAIGTGRTPRHINGWDWLEGKINN